MPSPIAMDAIDTITDRNGCNWCHHHEVQKRLWNKPLECNEKGRGDQPQSYKAALLTNATRALWVSQQNSFRNNDYCCRSVNPHNANTMSANRRPLEREALARSGKFMPQISCNESVEVNNKTCKKRTCKFQQKRNCHDTLATRQAHDTHSTNTKGKLTGSTRDTVPRQQNKCEWWWQQQQVPCYFGGIPKIRVVIGYSSGGIFIPAKWCDSLKANCWSNQWQKLVIQSYSHSNRLMATSSKYVYTQRSMGNS